MRDQQTLTGGCHCGAVRFEVDAPKTFTVDECNCSICEAVGYLHLLVAKEDFRVTQGEDALTDYRFGSGEARHRFCSICGVKSFYIPRSHPNGVAVNGRCLDDIRVEDLTIVPFDGRNWEANVAALRERKPDGV
ncbi:MAG: GFA family protein [Pseudomonadota bacterium]